MPPPDLEVIGERLREEASDWGELVEPLAGAATAAEGLALSRLQFGLAFFAAGAYGEAQQLVGSLLSGGAEAVGSLRDDLLVAADAYERADEDAIEDVQDIFND